MKLFVALCLLLSIALASNLRANQFRLFMEKYNKIYASDEERNFRFEIFQQNMDEAEERTRKSTHATFGMTKFSDLTKQEFSDFYLMRVGAPDFQKAPLVNISRVNLPVSFDWRTKNMVTAVKNQQQCGSCWDFSATETIESVWALAGHTLTVLSEQQILDCDQNDDGCNGGWPYNAYAYVISAGGLETEKKYPYTAQDGNCNFDSSSVVAKISNWQYVTQSQDENAMQQFLYQKSPLSVCVDAEIWQTYTGGVITPSDNCGDSIDHCVQATGFSQQSGLNVWNIRNSWGTDWGVNGFIYLQIGSDVCAVAEVVTVPIV